MKNNVGAPIGNKNRLEGSQAKNEWLQVRIDAETKAAIKDSAKKEGLNISQYLLFLYMAKNN